VEHELEEQLPQDEELLDSPILTSFLLPPWAKVDIFFLTLSPEQNLHSICSRFSLIEQSLSKLFLQSSQ
jgi:hypothetical protein